MTHEHQFRKRAAGLLAPAGITAALLAGAVAYAGPASADPAPTAPTLTLTMPTRVSNDAAPQNGSLLVDNSAAGTASIPGSGESLLFVATPPQGLKCTDVVLAPVAPATIAFGVPTAANGRCTWTITTTPASQAAGTKVTYKFTIAVKTPAGVASPVTGTLSSQVALQQVGTTTTIVAASNAASTQIVNPTPPTLAGSPPAATVHQSYSYQLMTDAGFPVAATTSGQVTVYLQTTATDGTKTCTPVLPVTAGSDTVVDLNDGLVYDETTGYLTAGAPDLTQTDSTPPTYIVVANNGVGGAASSDATTCPPTKQHDVSVSFKLPVLFADTATDSLFGKAIYTLADNKIISGYPDGDFHGPRAVTRDQFAHYIATYAQPNFTDGPCSSGQPSAFTDVPNGSPFCKSVNFLSSNGIVNGYGNAMFHPGGTIVRQEMAAFIYRAHAVFYLHVAPTSVSDAPCTAPTPFPDVTTRNVFCGDIEWLNANGITHGYPDGTFRPATGVARQEAAQFIYNLGVQEHHTY